MSAEPPKIYIVGIGGDGLAGLTSRARDLVASAEVLVGSDGALRLLPEVNAERVRIGSDLGEVTERLRTYFGKKRMVVVATGDPLFYGVARYLCDRLGKERFEVLPHVSSMQLAFARVKESWEDAYLTNLAGRPIEAVIDRIRTAEKVGLFSSDEFPPARLARELLDRGIDYFRAFVCENLGSPDERVTQCELGDLVGLDFNPLHVLILIRKPNRPDPAGRA